MVEGKLEGSIPLLAAPQTHFHLKPVQDVRLLKPRRWVQLFLGEKASAGFENIPDEVLRELYPNVYAFGPNGDAVQAFYDAVTIANNYMVTHEVVRSGLNVADRFAHQNSLKLPQKVAEAIIFTNKVVSESERIHVNAVMRLISYDGLRPSSPLDKEPYSEVYQRYMDAFYLNPEDYKWKGLRWAEHRS